MIWLSIVMSIIGFLGYVVFVIVLRNKESRTYDVLALISTIFLTFGCMMYLRLIGAT